MMNETLEDILFLEKYRILKLHIAHVYVSVMSYFEIAQQDDTSHDFSVAMATIDVAHTKALIR